MNEKKIVVVGSSNMDLIVRVSHLPQPGETIGGAVYTTAYGGKGANQAVAAARMGGNVTFVSAVGDDVHGERLIPYFGAMGMNVGFISKERDLPTGVAFIWVGDNGENCIAVAPGANGSLIGEKVEKILPAIHQADVLVLQLEIPYETVTRLIEYAHEVGTKVVLNPAPAQEMEKVVLQKTDVLILNETEAEIITGKSFADFDPCSVAECLRAMGPEVVILTLGAAGSVLVSSQLKEYIPGYQVNVVDTTGAGDTFCGAFVARWMETNDLEGSVRYATAAAAISVTALGAQPSIPYKDGVIEFIRNKD